jgi:hypothetical protein
MTSVQPLLRLAATTGSTRQRDVLQQPCHTAPAAQPERLRWWASVLALVLLGVVSAQAQVTYFRVGGGGNWNSMANWSLASGGAGGAGIPGPGDIVVFDAASGAPAITLNGNFTVGQVNVLANANVTFSAALAQTLTITGIAASATPPLFIASLGRMRVADFATVDIGAGGTGTPNGASISGTITVGINGAVTNSSTRPFFVESGGTLEMAGGTYTNIAGTIRYATTGACGTLMYSRPDNTTVIIPLPNAMNEVTNTLGNLGNLYIRRNSLSAQTTLANPGGTYSFAGQLTVDNSIFTLGDQAMLPASTMEFSSSRMLNGGRIQGNRNAQLTFTDPANLNPTTADLDFVATPGLFTLSNDNQGLVGLRNNVRTLNINLLSDLNIYGNVGGGNGLQITSAMAPFAGQITISATRTLSMRNTATGVIQGNNNGRIVVNGTLHISTNASISNDNDTPVASPLSGIVVNPNGRIRIWGGDANGATARGIISAGNVGRTFYVDATARLEYLDQGDGTATLNAGGFPITEVNFSQTPKLATRAEIPELMLGSITISRSSSSTVNAAIGNLRQAVLVNMPNQLPAPDVASTTLQGNLTLTQGIMGLNNSQVIVNGNVSATVGGSIAGTDVPGTSALVYRSSNAGQLRVTGATVTGVFGQNFNYVEIAGAGNLTLNGAYTLDGTAAVAQYGQAGANNYNGQLRFTGAGNLVMGSSEITFNGAAAANVTPAAQGGHIPSTTGTSGALFGDTGARLNFFSRAARSFPRFAAGGQQLGFLTVGNPAMAMTAVDYIASLRTPLTINGILTLQQNAVLQLGPGGNLSYQNANISFATPATPTQTGNFIDASQGGTLNITNVAAGAFVVPVGVGFTEPGAGYMNGFTPTLRRLTIQNPTAGENYTVTVTSAIVNAVPSLPTLAARSMRGQWNVTKGNPAFTGNITTEWFTEVYDPATGFGSEPAAANEFQPRMIANQSLTSLRRFSGGSYVNVLPVVTPLPTAMGAVTAAVPAPRLITATHTGTLSNTIFIISNELFPTFWVGGASDDWGITNNWASTSGGAPGSASVPGINDFPVFDRSVNTTIRRNIPSLTRIAPATALQKLSVVDGANVTLAPVDIPTTLELIQDADDDNLFVAQNARLNIGGAGAMNVTVRIPQMTGTMPSVALGTGPDATVFGTLALQNGGTFDVTNMTGSILIANGATLQMAGGTFQKAAATILQYGQNINSVRPYGNTGEQNATLSYSDNNGGIITPVIGATNELPATPLPGKLFINKTSLGAGVRFNMAYAITSSATVQAGILDISGITFQVGTGTVPATSVAAATAGVNRALVVNPNGLIRGTNTTVLGLNGMGAGTLRFEPGTAINTLSLNDLSAAAPNGGVNTTLLTDLVANDVQIVNGTRAVGTPSYSVPHALTIDNNRTLRILNAASAITSGRVLARGTFALDGTTPAQLALPAAFTDGGLDVATTGTLSISNAAVVNGTPAANPVRYLDRTSLLTYVNQGVGGSRTVNQTEMPNVFAGSMTVNKLSTMPANNVVSLDVCKAVTQGTLSLTNGFLNLNNFALKIGGVINPATGGLVAPPYVYAYADVLNTTANTSAMNMTGGFIVPNQAAPLAPNQAAIIYNSNNNSNLFLRQQPAAAMNVADPVNANAYPAIFLNKLEINGRARLTLATTSAVTIDNTAGLTACEPLNAGQLRLVDNTGELALNGSRLAFTGIGANGGRLITASTAGSIIGDALPSTSLRFLSSPALLPAPNPAMQVLRVGSGTGAQFHSIEVDVQMAAPNAQTYLRMTNPVTTVALGVTRGIISLTNSTVTLSVTGGINSTSGNQTANEAAFSALNPMNRNNNFIDCSGGGRLGLVIGMNQRRMFPVGAMNNTRTALRIAPVTIFNPGAADTYFVGADSIITNQLAVYPNRVNVQWNITKNSGSATNQEVQLGWHTEHETSLTRPNSFPAQWTGSAYNPFTNTINDVNFPGTLGNPGTAGYPVVQEWSQTVAPFSGTMALANPWVVLAPPIAVFVAADSLNFNGSGGFNPTNPNGFSTGQLTITSGTAFTIRASAFNGLNQRSPVAPAALPKDLFFNLHPAPGGTAIFTTTGTGSVGFPVQLNVPNPVSGTSTNITFNWVNARPTQMSTQADLHIWDGPLVGPNTLRAVPLRITINAPTASPNAVAFTNTTTTDPTRAVSTMAGFNNNAVQFSTLDVNGQPTLNVTGGVGIPINFGLYRIAPVDENGNQTGFIQNTSATLVDDRDFMITITNPPGGTAVFSTTGVAPSVTRATINIGQGTSTLFPIFNWTGYDHDSPIYGGPNAGVPNPGLAPGGGRKQPVGTTTAVITLTLRRYVPIPARDGGGVAVQILSTSITVQISSGATQAVTLAYSGVSQDITGLPDAMGIAPLEQRRLRPDGFGANYDANTVSVRPIPSDVRFPLLVGTFGANGAVLGSVNPAIVQLQIAPFPVGSGNFFAVDFNTDTLTSANPVRRMQPRIRWVNAPAAGGSAQAVLTLTHINGPFLQSTQVTITVTSSANLGIQTAFTQRGFPRTFNQGADGLTGLAVSTRAVTMALDPVAAIESGSNFNINFAIYNTSLLSADPFTSTVASIANPMANVPEVQGFGVGSQILGVYRVGFIPDNATDIIDIDQTSGFQTTVLSSINPLASFSNVRLNWRNAPLGAGPFVTTGRLVIGHAQSPFISSTTISVQIVSSATIPVTLAYSRISTTGSETLPQFPVVSGTPINIDLSLFSSRGALANSLTNIPVTLSVPSGFSITGNINGVFVNQSTITFNGVRVFWTGAPAAGGTTRVPITATPAMGSGIGATTASFTIIASNTQPQITGFSPTVASNPGFTDVTISGANLNGANSVIIGNVMVQIVSTSPGAVVVRVPQGASGFLSVCRPADPNGTFPAGCSNQLFFGMQSGPGTGTCNISDFQPRVGGAGTEVRITGRGFTGLTGVSLAGVGATIVSASDTVLVVRLGAAMMNVNGAVTVQTPSCGLISSPAGATFSYSASPVITSVTPQTIQVSGRPVEIIIRGQNFSTTGMMGVGREGVFFGVANDLFQDPIQVQSRTATEIRATIPATSNNRAGVRTLTVRNVDGQTASITITLTPAPAPTLVSVTPNTTTATGTAFQVLVRGRGFFGELGMNVTLNGVNTPFRALGDSLVIFDVPVSLNIRAGTVSAVIANNDGQAVTAQIRINDAPAPTITSITPPNVPFGAPSARIVVNGTGFFPAAIFQIGTTVVQPVFVTPTQAALDVPEAILRELGQVTLRVINTDGRQAFTVLRVLLPPPTITGFTPASGTTNATQSPLALNINGTNFRGAFNVTFVRAGTTTPLPLQVVATSATQIQLRVAPIVPRTLTDPSLEGEYVITVTNPDFQATTANYRVLPYAGPIISSVTPSSTAANGTAFVARLDGVNLANPQSVTFLPPGGVTPVPLQVLSQDRNGVSVLIPPGLNTTTGRARFSIVLADGQRFDFDYTTSVRAFTAIAGSLFPNPVSDVLTVEAEMPRPTTVRVRLSDVLGRTVVETREQVSAGIFRKQVDVSTLPAGVYIFEMLDGDRRLLEKVIKQ